MSNWSPLNVPDSPKEPFTDYSRWRLRNTTDGSHIWDYLQTDEDNEAQPQTDRDKYFLGIPLNYPPLPKANTPLDAARNGYTFYKHLQSPDGHWAGEYGGPMFLLPGLVIGSYVSGMTFLEVERLEMIRYVLNRAHPDDGGWGLHIEGESTVFGTAMNYTALRLLGVSAEHPAMVKARATLHKFGGAVASPSWGKFWLSVLNVYEWEGNNPVPTEILLLPKWVPFHPWRWWIHVRTVYIPMAYLSNVHFKAEENDLIRSLRQELYTQPYESIDWPAQCNNVSPIDVYAPHSTIFDFLNIILKLYEPCSIPPVRRAGIAEAYKLIVLEDENTTYQTLGPVSKMMNLVARFHAEGPESHAYKMHDIKRKDFMWINGEGMMMCGTNGSQLWDIGFMTQALVETGLAKEEENKDSLVAALKWLEECQMTEDPKHLETSNRHRTKGAWPFSTKEQGYTVSDCTGEGLKSVLYLQNHLDFTPKLVSDRRLFDAVDTLLTMQNPSGGFASYELIRGPSWLEQLNAAEVFGNIMIEYAYPECTTSVITSLSIFRQSYPSYRSAEISTTIQRAIVFLHNAQYPEGGWFGSWGICFTYATMFALESLSLVGETYETSKYAKKACDWLIGKQRADGGWGESWKTCETAAWVEHENTQVVQTCWAAMALIYAKFPKAKPIAEAVRLVMKRQLPDGSWPQEAIEGVFNKSCAISYPNFKFSFTVWMLGKAHKYLKEKDALGLVSGLEGL